MNRFLRFLAFLSLLFAGASLAGLAFAQGHRPPGAPPPGFPRPGTQAPPTTPPQSNAPNATPPAPGLHSPTKEEVKTVTGEEFFIVASIDLPKSQLLVKRPTEVTELMLITPQTKLLSDTGQSLKLSDFRAGDTVWALATGSGPQVTAKQIRKGQMTLADLHRYYLDYPEIR
jgi:hypothetical protein